MYTGHNSHLGVQVYIYSDLDVHCTHLTLGSAGCAYTTFNSYGELKYDFNLGGGGGGGGWKACIGPRPQ